MGKYIRKCKGDGEVAVMEVAQVGVRTRARAMAENSETALKKRKVSSTSGGELRLSSSFVVTPENSVSSDDQFGSVSSGDVPASCCSSNGSTVAGGEKLKFTDLEEESVECETSRYNLEGRERRESTPTSKLQEKIGEMESTVNPSELSSRRTLTPEKMPSESELEEFFATAEKDLHERFKEKYNYDFVKDVPLEGRFDWVQLKP